MRIAVLGAGRVGGTLGRRWASLGHEVVFGVRNRDSESIVALLARSGHAAGADTIEQATRDADIVVLAVPWHAAREVTAAAGDLGGKILIDATNPIVMSRDGLERGLLVGRNTSAAAELAAWLPETRVVKAFNTVGWEMMEDPRFAGVGLTLPLCGDDAEAKTVVAELARELGFEPVDVGPLGSARYLEPLAMLWIDMAVLRGFGRSFGFRLVHR